MQFTVEYRDYIREARKGREFGLNVRTIAKIEPFLSFLYQDWWKVDVQGLKNVPSTGPVLFVGNSGGVLPWAGLMLMYFYMKQKPARRLNILANIDGIEDERLYNFVREIGFQPWSADHAKKLFQQGELVAVFPEGVVGSAKKFGERYRVRNFDWTKVMPAIEQRVPLVPLATIGPEESFPVLTKLDDLARFLDMPAYPVTPFFPLLPFPVSMFSLPAKWKLRMLKPCDYAKPGSRADLEESAKKQCLFVEGEVQAELNRLLRQRIRAF